ncbi:RNA polymerase sigma factor [Paludisphaera rhizosphaerae]|uniref:RNA polymerase sigma factor n=1 Tax=Paludisphaera rhizosphaerae TaxID=2711216 RepID=UPI0013EE1C30|nr:sigma-70 family RNA polymerase sigma factor [Paludisphaera rhizosphaerae]
MQKPARRSPAGPLQTLLTLGVVGEETDARLLDVYRGRRTGAEEAFRLLVERHGPMVLSVCRSLVADPAEADDAFQAVFLVLIQRASSIRKGDSLGPWLYGVALRVAKAARRRSRSRAGRLRLVDPTTLEDAVRGSRSTPDASALIHAEIDRLPERERAPLVLCRLEGLTYERAARALGVPEPTLRGRLHRARKRLEERLKAQGVIDSPDSLTPVPLPLALLNAAQSLAAGATSTISASHLAKGAIFAMTLSSLKPVVFSSLATLGVIGSAAVLARQAETYQEPAQEAAPKPTPSEAKPMVSVDAPPQPKMPTKEGPETRDERIRAFLARPFDLDTDGIELETLLKRIKEVSSIEDAPGIPIYVNPLGLFIADLTMTSRVSFHGKNQPLSASLRESLAIAKLGYCVRDGFLMIDSHTGAVEQRLDRLEEKLDALIKKLEVPASTASPAPAPPGARRGPAKASDSTPNRSLNHSTSKGSTRSDMITSLQESPDGRLFVPEDRTYLRRP